MSNAKGIARKFYTIARVTIAAALLIAGVSAASPAQATTFPLVQTNPDITAFFADASVARNAGPLSSFSFQSPSAAMFLNAFDLVAINGNFSLYFNFPNPTAGSNTFSLSNDLGQLLLRGQVIGASDQSTEETQAYEFLVQLTDWDPTMVAAGFGATAGIILGVDDDFGSQADIFDVPGAPVPEPGTFLLLAAGLIGAAALKRRNS
jgi:hypothetical protein